MTATLPLELCPCCRSEAQYSLEWQDAEGNPAVECSACNLLSWSPEDWNRRTAATSTNPAEVDRKLIESTPVPRHWRQALQYFVDADGSMADHDHNEHRHNVDLAKRLLSAPAAQGVEPITKALAIVEKVAMFNGGFVADDLGKVGSTLRACESALRSYSRGQWTQVADYSDQHWYMTGEPWKAADSLLSGTPSPATAPPVEVDEACPYGEPNCSSCPEGPNCRRCSADIVDDAMIERACLGKYGKAIWESALDSWRVSERQEINIILAAALKQGVE